MKSDVWSPLWKIQPVFQKSPKGLRSRLSRLHTGCSFHILSYLALTPTQSFKGQKKQEEEARLRGSRSKACLVECKDHRSEKRTTPDSFVFGHERLFEVHWLGLNSPNISSHPPSTNTGYLFTSLHPSKADKTRGWEGEVAGGASRCPAPRDERSSGFTSPPAPAPPLTHSYGTHQSRWQAHLTPLAAFMGGVYQQGHLSVKPDIHKSVGETIDHMFGGVSVLNFPTAVAAL